MKKLILLAGSILLSACTLSPTGTLSGSTQRYETHNDIMNIWVGKSESELLAHWGTPEKIFENSNGSKTFVFRKKNPYLGIGCVSVFEVNQTQVAAWGYRGCPIRENKKDYKLIHKSIPIPQPTLDIAELDIDR